MKSKKAAIEDFGELFVTGLAIAIIIFLLLSYVSSLKKNTLEYPDMHINDLEALYTTRIILEWKANDQEYVYERIIILYNQNKKTEIIELIDAVIREQLEEPGKWIIAVGEYSDEQVHGGIDLTTKELVLFEGARKYLPKTTIPNPEGEPIKILIKRVSGGDYALINKGRDQSDTILIYEKAQQATKPDYTQHGNYPVGPE